MKRGTQIKKAPTESKVVEAKPEPAEQILTILRALPEEVQNQVLSEVIAKISEQRVFFSVQKRQESIRANELAYQFSTLSEFIQRCIKENEERSNSSNNSNKI